MIKQNLSLDGSAAYRLISWTGSGEDRIMADLIFENPRLVSMYDALDGPRSDLEAYVGLVKELGAKSVLDVGSGTGCFAELLAAEGFNVIGLEPARASMDLARSKPHADQVQWILGDATALPDSIADLAVMTGNVAQVFVSDASWETNLTAIHRALRPKGHLVFEVRDPSDKAWLNWNREKTYRQSEIPTIGNVESWCEVTELAGDLVSFRWTYVFKADGEVITSDSTLRFRSREEIERSLRGAGYAVQEVRGAPDRPGKEWVFIAAKA